MKIIQVFKILKAITDKTCEHFKSQAPISIRKMCVCVCVHALSHSVVSTLLLFGLVALQAPLSIGLCRQAYWSGLPFPTQGDLPNSGIKPASP